MLRFDSLGPQHHTINMIFDDLVHVKKPHGNLVRSPPPHCSYGPHLGRARRHRLPGAHCTKANCTLGIEVQCMHVWMDGWIDVSMHLCINVSI